MSFISVFVEMVFSVKRWEDMKLWPWFQFINKLWPIYLWLGERTCVGADSTPTLQFFLTSGTTHTPNNSAP